MQERLATVGQLAAGIAHDFNNIMAAIMIYADLLSNDLSLSLPSRERMTIIQQQVQRATSLIRQILDFSRRSVMEQSPMDLLPLLKELNKLLARVFPETIHLDFLYHAGIYMVNADPTRLQQVFMNLALNGRDAMPSGGKLIFKLERLRVRPGERPPHPDLQPGEWVRIVVEDTGCGISPEVMPRIFDPFFTTKPVGQGTGLGLSQVYGIVKQHQGHIGVESQVGVGSQFSVYLPCINLMQESDVDIDRPMHFTGAGRKVLVVEDDETTRNALETLLQAYHFHVLKASNGREALEVFREHGGSISLVVTDLVMPEIGGLELFPILHDHWPDVKVLFVTGHPLDPKNQILLETGDVHWLQKPFSAQEFAKAVQSLLSR
jgi:CheY-like chemotaxis protein